MRALLTVAFGLLAGVSLAGAILTPWTEVSRFNLGSLDRYSVGALTTARLEDRGTIKTPEGYPPFEQVLVARSAEGAVSAFPASAPGTGCAVIADAGEYSAIGLRDDCSTDRWTWTGRAIDGTSTDLPRLATEIVDGAVFVRTDAFVFSREVPDIAAATPEEFTVSTAETSGEAVVSQDGRAALTFAALGFALIALFVHVRRHPTPPPPRTVIQRGRLG